MSVPENLTPSSTQADTRSRFFTGCSGCSPSNSGDTTTFSSTQTTATLTRASGSLAVSEVTRAFSAPQVMTCSHGRRGTQAYRALPLMVVARELEQNDEAIRAELYALRVNAFRPEHTVRGPADSPISPDSDQTLEPAAIVARQTCDCVVIWESISRIPNAE